MKRDVLVIFSDMLQETGELNSTRVQPCASEIIDRAKTHQLLANLRDADVYALGTDLPGKSKNARACVNISGSNISLRQVPICVSIPY